MANKINLLERAQSAQSADGDDPLARLVQRAAGFGPAAVAQEERLFGYVTAGFALHLRGPAGCGKTTLALRLAERLRRPVLLLVGDASLDTRHLVGGEAGTRTKRVVDRYISSVMKVESETENVWLDRALTIACLEGCTLIYDEFNRAPPAANNVLLTVLEERVLVLPRPGRSEAYIKVNPDFRVIFTSNPSDHVGTHLAQDALLDRLITIDMTSLDRDSEIRMVSQRTGVIPQDVARVVDIVRDLRVSGETAQPPTLRAALAITELMRRQNLRPVSDDPRFMELCVDVLAARLRPGTDHAGRRALLEQLVCHFCPPGEPVRHARGARA